MQNYQYHWTVNDFIAKNNFCRKHPKYDDFSIIGEFSEKRSIDSSFQSEKKKFDGGTLYMDFDKKFFKMSNK